MWSGKVNCYKWFWGDDFQRWSTFPSLLVSTSRRYWVLMLALVLLFYLHQCLCAFLSLCSSSFSFSSPSRRSYRIIISEWRTPWHYEPKTTLTDPFLSLIIIYRRTLIRTHILIAKYDRSVILLNNCLLWINNHKYSDGQQIFNPVLKSYLCYHIGV